MTPPRLTLKGLSALFTRPLYTLGPCAYGDGTADWFGPHHCEHCAAAVEAALSACITQRAA